MYKKNLRDLLHLNSLTIPDKNITSISELLEVFQKWNKIINLSAHKSILDVIERDIVDAVYLSNFISNNYSDSKNVIDIGCGGGLVGLVVTILTGLKMSFLDSDRKKISFIKEVARKLKLEGCTFYNCRIEELPNQNVQNVHFDLTLTRATWPLKQYLNYVHNYVHSYNAAIFLGSEEQAKKEMEEVQKTSESFHENGSTENGSSNEQEKRHRENSGEKKIIFYSTKPSEIKRSIIIYKKMT